MSKLEAATTLLGVALAKHALSSCESPIEELLLCALMQRDGHPLFVPRPFRKGPEPLLGGIAEYRGWWLAPQLEVKGYRLDFALVSGRGLVAIECDGHEFHERTKEQAEHDKKRDRVLQIAGWKVLRFPGSEIHRDPDGCASQVFEALAAIDGGSVEDFEPERMPIADYARGAAAVVRATGVESEPPPGRVAQPSPPRGDLTPEDVEMLRAAERRARARHRLDKPEEAAE